MRGAAHMKNATACPFLGGGTPALLSMEGKSSNELLQRVTRQHGIQNGSMRRQQALRPAPSRNEVVLRAEIEVASPPGAMSSADEVGERGYEYEEV